MINGYCIGGAFTHCICSDFAVSANEAIFSLSEVNWGILPGGMVSKMVSDTLRARDAMFYACTGRTFNGKKAAEIGLVNYSVPLKNLKKEVIKLAKELMEKNPHVLRGTKHAIRATQNMDWMAAGDYLAAKGAEIKQRDAARGHDAYSEGIRQFIDEKAYKPVFSPYHGAAAGKAPAKLPSTRKKAPARAKK
jgi:trans-feruloyl-CoA hydratase/vanillin synthase